MSVHESQSNEIKIPVYSAGLPFRDNMEIQKQRFWSVRHMLGGP